MNEESREEYERLTLLYLTKFKLMEKEYVDSPESRPHAGILLLNEAIENHYPQIRAFQFGPSEVILNVLLVAMMKALEAQDKKTQVQNLLHIAETFINRAHSIIEME